MDTAFILIFFLVVLIFDFCRKAKKRSRPENIFYLLALSISLTVLLLKSLDLLSFHPVTALTELFDAMNLLP